MYRRHKLTYLTILSLVLMLVFTWGCQKKGEEISLQEELPPADEIAMPQVPDKIMVSDEIASAWKAVVLELTDKDTNERNDITVNIGETVPLGDTGLTIFVEAFLPSFTMAGDVFTSSSSDLNNPAAKAKITDGTGAELFNSWLFSMYPATHPLEHPKYALILKDYVAAE